MTIALIGAMEQEVVLLRSKIQGCETIKHAGYEIYTGTIENVKVALLRSGIGKVAAAIGTTLLFERFPISKVINTGSAGGLAHHLTVGDIVISKEVGYHDVDLTAFGYAPGEMSGLPRYFHSDKQLVQLAHQSLQELGMEGKEGLICSGDQFINGATLLANIRKNFPHAIGAEMEAAAIAQVCHQYQCPFVVVRAISDVADHISNVSFEQFLTIAAKHSSIMVETMLRNIASINSL